MNDLRLFVEPCWETFSFGFSLHSDIVTRTLTPVLLSQHSNEPAIAARSNVERCWIGRRYVHLPALVE